MEKFSNRIYGVKIPHFIATLIFILLVGQIVVLQPMVVWAEAIQDEPEIFGREISRNTQENSSEQVTSYNGVQESNVTPEQPRYKTVREVPQDHFAYSALRYLVRREIINEDTAFNGDATLNRYECAVLLNSVFFRVGTSGGTNPFVDVPANHWAYDSVRRLTMAGIMDGMGNGTFQGEKGINRYEMAQMLAKILFSKNKEAAKYKANNDKLVAELKTEIDNINVRKSHGDKVSSNELNQLREMVQKIQVERVNTYNEKFAYLLANRGNDLSRNNMVVVVPNQGASYADVPAKHWAYDAVRYLSRCGVLEPDSNFYGDQSVTHFEAIVMVSKATRVAVEGITPPDLPELAYKLGL